MGNTKDNLSREAKLETIKRQGTAFMRAIKIQEKGKRKKVYFIRPYINQQPVYVQFNSRSDAEQFLNLLPASTTNKNNKVFFDYYFKFIKSIKVSNTAKAYWYTRKYLEPISKKPIDQIIKDDLIAVQNSAPKSTWNQLLGVFKGVADVADDRDFYFLVHKFNKDKDHQYTSRREDVHNPDEIVNAVLGYASENHSEERAKLVFLIICFTGLRVGELLAMTRSDWERKEIKVSKTVIEEFTLSGSAAKSKMAIQNHTKGKKDRNVPLQEKVKILVDRYYDLLEQSSLGAHPHRKSISQPLAVIKKKLITEGHKIDKLTPKM